MQAHRTELAALARIKELRERRTHMTAEGTWDEPAAEGADRGAEDATRCGLGRSATTTGSRPRPSGSSARCSSRRVGSSAGQRVLDVAGRHGQRGPSAPPRPGRTVVASDLTPGEFRRQVASEARRCGVELDWIEADAEALPVRAMASSTSSPPRSARSSPPTIRPWPTSWCACAGPGAGSGCSTSHLREVRFRLLRGLGALRAAALWIACHHSGATRGARSGSLGERVESLELTRREVRGEGRQPAWLLRAAQRDLRAGGRPSTRASPIEPEPSCSARQGLPRVRRHARNGAPPKARRSTPTSTCSWSPANGRRRAPSRRASAFGRDAGSAPAPPSLG